MTLNCNGSLIDLTSPKIMGIVNATPDSFYSKSRINNDSELGQRIESMIDDGASIIDIGAYSSRPNADHISVDEELKRLIPVLEFVRENFPSTLVSIDTFRATVAQESIDRGIHMINDISGGQLGEAMLEVVGAHQVPYILMHMKGSPQTMQQFTKYQHLSSDLLYYFTEQINKARAAGIKDIIIDPGFGFSKTLEQNYELLKNLDLFKALETPILVGLSRKSMIYKALDISAEEALNGTTALHMTALSKGAHILRVHDVKEAAQCVKLHQLLS